MPHQTSSHTKRRRRSKRDKKWTPPVSSKARAVSSKNKSKSSKSPSGGGGVEALLPSAVALVVLGFAMMARMGFRGRVDVVGIDLGTTNSVVCVQALTDSVGKIDCIPDPVNNSPLIPSVVSFTHPHHHHHHHEDTSSTTKSQKHTHSKSTVEEDQDVVVGHMAKLRIDSHPHSTFYHAKRFLAREYQSEVVQNLKKEVEFGVVQANATSPDNPPDEQTTEEEEDEEENEQKGPGVMFYVPGGYLPHDHSPTHKNKKPTSLFPLTLTAPSASAASTSPDHQRLHYISPIQIGTFVIRHLLSLTALHLGYSNIKSAVIAVPAKFDSIQRQATAAAFQNAGLRVARVLEEPTAAALAYGLHRKPNVNHILVYDFGGGTLDVSVLHVSDGYVEVMGSEGDDNLGGADFDAALAHALMEGKVSKELEVMGKVLEGLEEAYVSSLSSEDGGVAEEESLWDWEEHLANDCPTIAQDEIPLCHVSSLHTIAERMKIALSDEKAKEVTDRCLALPPTWSHPTSSSDALTFTSFCEALQPTQLSITQEEFDKVVAPLYDRSLLPVRRVLNDLDLSSQDIDEVVMVGGTTRMPAIRRLVKEELHVEALNVHIDPDITVAYGAASVID